MMALWHVVVRGADWWVAAHTTDVVRGVLLEYGIPPELPMAVRRVPEQAAVTVRSSQWLARHRGVPMGAAIRGRSGNGRGTELSIAAGAQAWAALFGVEAGALATTDEEVLREEGDAQGSGQ